MITPAGLPSASSSGLAIPSIVRQNQIRKTFQQALAEFFLAAQLPFHRALLCDVDQCALVTDKASLFHHASRCIDADRDSAIFFSQPQLSSARAAALASGASKHRLPASINTQLLGRQVQQIFLAVISQY